MIEIELERIEKKENRISRLNNLVMNDLTSP